MRFEELIDKLMGIKAYPDTEVVLADPLGGLLQGRSYEQYVADFYELNRLHLEALKKSRDKDKVIFQIERMK